MIPTDSLDLSGDVSGVKSPLYPRVNDTIFFKKRQRKAGKPMVYVNLKQLRKSCKSSLSDALGFLIREFIRKGITRSR